MDWEPVRGSKSRKGYHYEQWRKQEWFAPRMQRWHKENLIPYVQGERIYADDFYLLHVQG